MTLEQIGFCDWFKRQTATAAEGTQPARVVAIHKGWCDLSDGTTTRPARTTGKLRRSARSSGDYLTVGDWVMASRFDSGDFALVESILDRRNALSRKTAGREVRRQLIAANIDTAFVIHTLDKGFNLPKLERYLSIVNESAIHGVILLSKSDLPPKAVAKARLEEVRARIPTATALAFSNTTGEGMKSVERLFKPGQTHCLIGASGVGKTSLINRLLGEEDRYFTLPVRESDGKGIHTTTWRELIVLENGALVVDTPGMRELGYLEAAAGIQDAFEDIAELEPHCRFRDCAHTGTAGCAVVDAVESGSLARARYENFIRMKKEAAANQQAQREQRWKKR